MQRIFLEPLSTVLHLIAGLLALPGTLWLLWLARHDPARVVSLLVYGVSLVALFAASSLLHGLRAPARVRDWLNRLDHAAIFVLIAGTYTPIVAHLFPAPWRAPLLLLVWTVAAMGVAHKLVSVSIHGFFSVAIYLALGWGGALPVTLSPSLRALIPTPALGLLLLGGLIFTVGFVVYYWERPDPWPGVFGHHEIWHLFVIGGSLCHYLVMLLYVAPVR